MRREMLCKYLSFLNLNFLERQKEMEEDEARRRRQMEIDEAERLRRMKEDEEERRRREAEDAARRKANAENARNQKNKK